uniref:Polyprenyl synthetase n=3 Tax=Lutzomyia longipalpis TaxID=7200 RepID=A0A1B0GKD3_LUTLO
MEYIMPGSNRFPGVITVETYKLLTPEHKHTTENLKLAYYLGWILEIVLEAINMSDDVYDECKTRRNRVCWHELPDVGPSAVNDAFMMEAGAYYLLKKYFGKPDCHTRLLEILNETTFLACIGQHVDVISSKDFDKIKIETFDDIVANISVYLASFSSIALGMTLAGYTNLSIMKEAKSILADIGYFYVIQNDFYDSFGDPNVMGKVSSDIGEGRCRWPALLTMQLGTPEQKEVLKVNYGRKDPECVAKVIELYRELNLPRLYDDYCNNLGSRMLGDVDKLQDGDMKKICEKLVESVFYAMYKKYPVFV